MEKSDTPPETRNSVANVRGSRRILIIGAGGSGKSTLARRLGGILGLEVVHLDRHYWGSGWENTPRTEWEEVVKHLISRESWIMDGNYSGTLDLRLDAADAVIFLDLPRRSYIRRAITRRLRYAGTSRPDMAAGCQERITFQFLKHLWKYPSVSRPDILGKLRRLSSQKIVVVLGSSPEVRQFLLSLGQ